MLQPDAHLEATRILPLIAKFTGVDVEMILNKSRDEDVVYARHFAAWVIHKRTGMTHANLGRFLGDRDRGTMRWGIVRIEALLAENPVTAARADAFMQSLDKSAADSPDVANPPEAV